MVTLDTYCLQYCVENLKEKSEYTFRVMAENVIGLSAPAVTENLILKTHASKRQISSIYLTAHYNGKSFLHSRSVAADRSTGNPSG